MSEISINLAPRKKQQLSDRLLYFVLNYFRYIIILTQIVVIGVFFYRLMQDQKIVKLEQDVKHDQRILLIMGGLVDEAQALEKKTEKLEVFIDGQELFKKRLMYIFSSTPEDITISRMSVNEEYIQINGVATNYIYIRSFNEKMKKSKYFMGSEIVELSRKSDVEYTFQLSIPLKKKPSNG